MRSTRGTLRDVDVVLALLALAGTIALVVAIWYLGSLLVLTIVSKVFPLTGRRRRD
jgi:hypothetical protein